MQVVKFWYNPNFLSLFFLVILSIPALKSLAASGFYTSHDGETHTARIAQYYVAVRDGQIPPRFADSFYNGLGSPIFVYIYPLPYLLGSFIHFLGFSFTDSFEILMAFGFIFSAIFAYFWLKVVFKSEKAAFLGALFYVWVPYRFLLIYVRASLSENLAYTFLPLCLFCLTKLNKQKTIRWTALSAISIALLLLSQNLVALMGIFTLVGYFLITVFWGKSLRYLILGVFSFGWGFLIASVTYLPVIFERGFVRLSEIIKVAYPDHFVTLKQLIRSPWGYGFDFPGTFNDQLSFQLGLAHLLVLVIFLILFLKNVYKLFFLKQRVKRSHLGILIIASFFLIVFTFSILLMTNTPLTIYIWQKIKPLQIIDIPWRFLGITVLSLSFISAFVAKYVKSGLLFLMFVALVLVANRNHLRINQSVDFKDDHFLNYTGTATQYNEFTPIWRQSTRVPIGFDPSVKTQEISGQFNIDNLLVKSNEISFNVDVSSTNAQVRINKFYFPGWSMIVDSQKLQPFKNFIIINPASLHLEKEQDSSGLMLVNLDRGKHRVFVKFQETPLRLLANYFTVGFLILALGGVVIRRANK